MSDADDKSVPFARRQVVWGRPPQTTFMAGPLPRGTGLMPPVPAPETEATKPAAAPAAPRAAPRPASGNVLGGSLVPQRRAPPQGVAPNFLTAPAPVAPRPQVQPQPARAAAPVDATPRPLPPVQTPAAPVAARAPTPTPAAAM